MPKSNSLNPIYFNGESQALLKFLPSKPAELKSLPFDWILEILNLARWYLTVLA